MQLQVPMQLTTRRPHTLAVGECNGCLRADSSIRACAGGPSTLRISCAMAAAVQDGCQAPFEAGSSDMVLLNSCSREHRAGRLLLCRMGTRRSFVRAPTSRDG